MQFSSLCILRVSETLAWRAERALTISRSKVLAEETRLQYRSRLSEPVTAAIETEDRLPRRIGLWTAVAILIGSTIGSGIFRSPAGIAQKLPGPLPLLTIWLVGGLFALCGALTLAEVATAYPQTGGVFIY